MTKEEKHEKITAVILEIPLENWVEVANSYYEAELRGFKVRLYKMYGSCRPHFEFEGYIIHSDKAASLKWKIQEYMEAENKARAELKFNHLFDLIFNQ